ncbi:MFS transporter [Fodinisporobacter ferrooxydans]|uniref:MFS transporter n=1 Tax=Fodinisporobacter ferrooxydans TaxID=2901836 RepID=A0ABY4CJX9_9BACL|nr:MFS transporter [Alicyclobacillaceae bacterium MYW30-H2]
MNSAIFFIAMVSLFTDLSSQMIVPILPLFLTAVLHVQVGTVGLIEGIAESTASILKLFSGWFSDRIGRRKPLMIAGYGVSNLVKPLFALSASWGQVLAIRFADRLGKGMRGAPRDAFLADATNKEERGKAFGFRRSMDTLGAALGPLAAFWILDAFPGKYRAVFWASAIPGVLAVLILVFFLAEEKKEIHSARGLPKFGFQSLGRPFMVFTFISTLFTIGNFSDAFLVLRAQNVGMTPSVIPLAYLLFNVVCSIFSTPLGVLSDRFGRRPVLVSGFFIFACIYFGFGMIHRASWVWVLFAVYGFYYAATEGIQKAYIADIVAETQRGIAMGTYSAVTGLAALPASILAGVLWETFGPSVAFATGGMLAAIAGILLLLIRV